VEAAGRRAGTGKVLDTAENSEWSVGPSGSEMIFVRILDAKANDFAVLQFAASICFHSQNAAAVPRSRDTTSRPRR